MPSITEYMNVLISGTPLSLDLLREGWPYFSFAEKVELLSALLSGKHRLRWDYQINFVLDLALADENPLIRRVAAKHIYKPTELTPAEDRIADQARFDKVRTDSSLCVREHWDEDESWGRLFGGNGEDFQPFWDKTHYQRLHFVHGLDDEEWIAGSLSFALENHIPSGRVTLTEAMDVLIQFFTWRDYSAMVTKRLEPWDGPAPRGIGSALWSLVPKVPSEIKWVLLAYLNEAGCTQEILNSLEENQLAWMLARHNFDLSRHPSLRLNCFMSGSEKVKRAALSSPTFTLSDSDISEFIIVPEDNSESRIRKLKGLRLLAESYSGGTLYQLGAIDLIESKQREELIQTGYESWGYRGLEKVFANRIEAIPYGLLKLDIFTLRLFYLAWSVTTSPNGLPPEIGERWKEKFEKGIIKDNPWMTFLNFRKNCSSCDAILIKALPSIDEFRWAGIPAHLRGEDEEFLEGAIDLVTEASQLVETLPKSERAVLSAITGGLTALQRGTSAIGSQLQPVIERLDDLTSRVKTIMVVGIGVIAWMIFIRSCK